jgi:hypothetical protein
VRVTNEFTSHCGIENRRAKRQLLARLCFSLLLSFAQAKESRESCQDIEKRKNPALVRAEKNFWLLF